VLALLCPLCSYDANDLESSLLTPILAHPVRPPVHATCHATRSHRRWREWPHIYTTSTGPANGPIKRGGRLGAYRSSSPPFHFAFFVLSPPPLSLFLSVNAHRGCRYINVYITKARLYVIGCSQVIGLTRICVPSSCWLVAPSPPPPPPKPLRIHTHIHYIHHSRARICTVIHSSPRARPLSFSSALSLARAVYPPRPPLSHPRFNLSPLTSARGPHPRAFRLSRGSEPCGRLDSPSPRAYGSAPVPCAHACPCLSS